MANILGIHDQPAMRSALVQLHKHGHNIQVAGTVEHGIDGLESNTEVVILGSAFAVMARRFQVINPQMKIIVLSDDSDDQTEGTTLVPLNTSLPSLSAVVEGLVRSKQGRN